MLAYSGRRCGSTYPGAALLPRASVGLWESRAEGPALLASGVSESRHWGRQGVRPGHAVVGLADETSERGRLCSISLVRSSRRQPSTTACPGGDDLPQGGGAAPNCCVAERRSENLGVCQLWKENHRGVKIIRAQDYAGVDNFSYLLALLASFLLSWHQSLPMMNCLEQGDYEVCLHAN